MNAPTATYMETKTELFDAFLRGLEDLEDRAECDDAAAISELELIKAVLDSETDEEFVAALRALVRGIDHELHRADIGCLVCTRGTTPVRYETGTCWLHQAQIELRKLEGK